MAVGKLCKTQYGEGEVMGLDEANQMYEIKLPFGTAYMKREQFEISCGQDVLIWHLPVNYKIARIWSLLGKKYPVNAQRKRMVSIAVESAEEAKELCDQFNNTKMGGNFVGFRFDEPRKRKERKKGRRKRVPRPLRLLLTPDGFGRTLETKRNYNVVSTSGGVKLFKRMDCQEVHFVQTNDGLQYGFVKNLNENGLVDLETNLGSVIVSFKELNALTKVETPYGNGEVLKLGRGEMLQIKLDFGTLYSQPCHVKAIPQEIKETGI